MKFISFSHAPRGAFSLIELVVVSAIIAIIASIAVPMARSVAFKSRKAGCLSNLRQIGAALTAYVADHDQMLLRIPANMNEWLAGGEPGSVYRHKVEERPLNQYLGGANKVFRSPLDVGEKNRTDSNLKETYYERTGSSYLYNSRINLNTVPLRVNRAYSLVKRLASPEPDGSTLAPVRITAIEEPSRTLAFVTPDIRGMTDPRGIVWWLDKPQSLELHAHALFVDGHIREVKVGNGLQDTSEYRIYAGGQ